MTAAAPLSNDSSHRVRALVADDPRPYAVGRKAELVDWDAIRGEKTAPRAWLEQVAAMEGRSRADARALANALLERCGLVRMVPPILGGLSPFHRCAIALAESAIGIAGDPANAVVVVPEPPLAWPVRHDVRRLALDLFRSAEVVLHAREGWELASLVPAEAVIDGDGRVLAQKEGRRSLLARVYGRGEPYEAWRAALEALGVAVMGGPIAHVLIVPEGVGAREVLAAAHETAVDVLEVRELLEGFASPATDEPAPAPEPAPTSARGEDPSPPPQATD